MDVAADENMSKRVNVFVNKLNKKIDTPEEIAYNHLIKADAYRMKNFFWEAIDEYLLALDYDKNNFEVYKGLGLAYKQVGFTYSAIGAFNNAKALAPFDKTLYYETACCYCIDKKFTKAISQFKRALKICPDYIEAKLNISLAYELSNQHDSALKNYLAVIEEYPENVCAYNALGSLYIKIEMYGKAIKTFRELLKVDKNYSRAYLGIAIALDKLNCVKESLRYYKKYMKLKPNCSNIPFILDRVEELKGYIAPVRKSHLKLVS